jgi:hypothetical protein
MRAKVYVVELLAMGVVAKDVMTKHNDGKRWSRKDL